MTAVFHDRQVVVTIHDYGIHRIALDEQSR
jgi:hypothetical protein